jgi:quinol-cytochrome oxidoreductase complex cytochrome b subunit
MFYVPTLEEAYLSIMYINNEVFFGWWARSLHSNGASFFFLVVYVHMSRGIYYGSFSFPRQILWISGAILWILMIMTAFFGYILPWGQMSYWAATVITSLFNAIPLIGYEVVYLLWGGYSIGDATLKRFYTLHFSLPFVIFFFSIIHVAFLHERGSNNQLGIYFIFDFTPFSPYFILKDTLSLTFILFFFTYVVFFTPDLLSHPDNYIMANPLVTPSHIVPEWYFLPLYAVLRSVDSKLVGIVLLVFFFLLLVFLPFVSYSIMIRSGSFKPFFISGFWFFIVDCISLGWIGGLPASEPYVVLGLKYTLIYFFILSFYFPFTNSIDRFLYELYIFVDNFRVRFISNIVFRFFVLKKRSYLYPL